MRSHTMLKLSIVCLVITLLITLSACGFSPYDAVAGTWQTAQNKAPGFGREAETLTFFKDGQITLQTPTASVTGEYSFVAGAELKIDWKRQHLPGHSTIEVFKVSIELHTEPPTLSLTNSDQKKVTYYRVQLEMASPHPPKN
jgi:uncharacterized lipoprotein YehR (DUF1307 family)